MSTFNKTIRLIESTGRLLGQLSGWSVAAMMVLVGVEVFMRYVFNRPPMVADEFAAYLLVAISFLGLSYTFSIGGHVRITFLVNRVSDRTGKWIRLFTLILSEFFTVVMCVAAYQYVVFSKMLNERSASWIHFPLIYPQTTILIGFIVLTLVILTNICKTIVSLHGEPGDDAKT